MWRWRRAPLVSATIRLLADRARVRIEPEAGRWPEHAPEDRLTLGAGCAALTLSRMPDALLRDGRAALARAAASLAGPEPDPRGSGLPAFPLLEADEPSADRPDAEVTIALLRSAAGPVPSLGRPPPRAADLLAATLGLLLALGLQEGTEERLAAALSLEGLLGWYAAADPGFQPPQQALAYALRHAEGRLEEAGRPVPSGLRIASAAQVVMRPMAGGA
jgi:hypothetical protein